MKKLKQPKLKSDCITFRIEVTPEILEACRQHPDWTEPTRGKSSGIGGLAKLAFFREINLELPVDYHQDKAEKASLKRA